MANLTPTPGWDGVFQLETDTPVLGGAGGVSNSQAQALLNRTAFLESGSGASKVGYTPAGTGAVSANAESHMRKIVSRSGYSSDVNYNLARLALSGRSDVVVRPSRSSADLLLSDALSLGAVGVVESRPAYLEQFMSGFFGRGMLTAETPFLVTEQALTATASQGATSIQCTSASNFVAGGSVTIKHDNGLYKTYFVYSKATDTITITPSLKYDCLTAASRIERTWYDPAHPGKFYMRELAQRISKSEERDASFPNGGRVLFTNLSNSSTMIEDTLVSVGGAAINYYSASNTGSSGNTDTPVRFTFGQTAFVDGITASGQGAETQLFDTKGIASSLVKVTLRGEGSNYLITIIDESGQVLGSATTNLLDQRVFSVYTIPVDLRASKKIKVRIACNVYSSAGSFSLAQVDIFESPSLAKKIIQDGTAKIVCLGDSWVAGNLAGSLEREPLTQQLAIEMPYATIINAGIGGNTIVDMLARFDSDVAAHNPDYVVVNTGTNESYNPLSGTFEPNAVDAFIQQYMVLLGKISAIGARPIIIGIPALAQSDPAVPAFPEFQLNNRARIYARYFFERASTRPIIKSGSNANGAWAKFDDGTLICTHTVSVTTASANTLGITTWTYPNQFLGTPKITVSVSSYTTGQILASGHTSATANLANINLMSAVAGTTAPLDCVAVGRWA